MAVENDPMQVPGTTSRLSRLPSQQLQRAPTADLKGMVVPVKVGGIDVRYFLLQSENDTDGQIKKNLPAMAGQILKMNPMMADPAFAVKQLFVWTGATTGFRIVLGKPTIYIDTKYVISGEVRAIAHEMGHAIAHSYLHAPSEKSGTEEKPSGFHNVLLKLAETYLILKKTKTQRLSKLVAKIPEGVEDADVPLGLFLFSPLNWSKTGDLEHPWESFDEFFASAFEGFLVNRKGLEASIKKFAAQDSSITSPSKAFVGVLEAVYKQKLPPKGYTIKDKKNAEHEITRAGRAPEIVKRIEGGQETFVYPATSTGLPGGASPESTIRQPLLYLVESVATEEKAKQKVQPRSEGAEASGIAPPVVHRVLSATGEPMDRATRAFMEPRFGHDFSRVRVHNDDLAAESARAVRAHAYTVGSHVVMGKGRYRPDTRAGRLLLAHELSHVLQQKDLPFVSSRLSISGPADELEREAEANAGRIAVGELPRPTRSSEPVVARSPDDPEAAPRFGGQIADIAHDIREQRERRYQRLAEDYRRSLMSTSGIRHGGPIASPQEALQVVQRLHLDNELNTVVQRIRTSTANIPQGPQTSDTLRQRASQGAASLSPLGRTTLNQALAAVRSEPFFRNLIDSNEFDFVPDNAVCGRFNAFTLTGEGDLLPGAQRARATATLVLICRRLIDSGNLEQLRSTLAHELSHAAERLIAGRPTARLVTEPVIRELSVQLARLPQFQGMERPIRQFLDERIGSPQGEIFADLQQLPQSPQMRQDDRVLAVVVCELRRMDAAGLPQSVRGTLIDDLRLRTEAFYRLRIERAQGAQARQLQSMSDYALTTLRQALLVRQLEQRGAAPVEVRCST
jgi:hypothetical protein